MKLPFLSPSLAYEEVFPGYRDLAQVKMTKWALNVTSTIAHRTEFVSHGITGITTKTQRETLFYNQRSMLKYSKLWNTASMEKSKGTNGNHNQE